jgi:hypothetical protein
MTMSPFAGKPVEPALPRHFSAAVMTELTLEPATPGETMSSRKLTVDAELEPCSATHSGIFCTRLIPPTGW